MRVFVCFFLCFQGLAESAEKSCRVIPGSRQPEKLSKQKRLAKERRPLGARPDPLSVLYTLTEMRVIR